MPVPQHKFVSSILPSHKGYPQCGWYNADWAGHASNNWEEGLPPMTVPQQCLQYGVNPQRVSINHSTGALSATLTWETGDHDFEVGDYIRLTLQGSGTSTVDGYYKVSAVPDATHAVVDVPAGTAFASVSSPVTEDLDYTYLTFALTGNTSINDDLVSTQRGVVLGDYQVGAGAGLSGDAQKFGTTSFDFNANGKYVAIVSRTILANSADFTLDAWVHPVSAGSGTRFIAGWDSTHSGPTQVGLTYDASSRAIGWYHGGTVVVASPDTIPLNQWSHVAVTRSDGYITLFVNGVKQATASYRSSWATLLHVMRVGGSTSGDSNFPGYIQCVRLYKGKARWSNTFPVASVDHAPALRYGVGYFAVRGGDIIRPAAYLSSSPGGTAPYNNYSGAHYVHWVLRSYYDEAPGIVPTYSVSGYGNIYPFFSYTYSMHTGSLNRTDWNGIVSFGEYPELPTDAAPKISFAFVFSNAGFYQYWRCHTYSHSAYRAGCCYYGKTTNLASTAGLSDQEAILGSCVLFSYSPLNTKYNDTAIRSNVIAGSFNAGTGTGGLLMCGGYTYPTGWMVTLNTSSGDNSLNRMIHPSDPTSHINTYATGLLGAANMDVSNRYSGVASDVAKVVLGMGMVVSKPATIFGRGFVHTPPGSLWVTGGAVADTVTIPFRLPSKTTIKMYGDTRSAVYMPSFNTYGVISLDVQDWETR